MQRAIEMASSGWMSVREAAERNGIPSTTLHDRVSGRVSIYNGVYFKALQPRIREIWPFS